MNKNNSKQPHAQKVWAYQLSPRCGAKRKYDGQSCKAPAAHGKGRCRLHGGAKGSGASKGNQNSYKHGFYSKEIKKFRRAIGFIVTASKQTIDDIE